MAADKPCPQLQPSLGVRRYLVKSHSMRIQKDFDPQCAGSDDAQIIIWDAETGAFLASNNMHQLRVLQVIFANESQVISMSNNKLIMWDSPASSFKGTLDVVDFRRYIQGVSY